MFYLIKFLYQMLLPPACIFVLLCILNAYMYRKKAIGRYFLSIILFLFYFLSTRIGADFLSKPLENYYIPPSIIHNNDVILMLGNGSVASVPDVDGTGQPAGTMANSMLTALRIQHKTGLPILVSGGEVYHDMGNEADIALREFSSLGISKNILFAENKSINTFENAKLSRAICNKNGWKHPLLLVVALQAPRTAMIFQKEGIDCTIYPTNFRRAGEWHFQLTLDLLPDATNLADSAASIKEYMGIVTFKLLLLTHYV